MKRVFLLGLLMIALCNSATAQTQDNQTSIITLEGSRYYVYTVRAGDTFYALNRQYGASKKELQEVNPHMGDALQPGQVLKIPVQQQTASRFVSERKQNRLFEIHTVNQGETAYSISKRYGVSLQTLIADNEGFDPAHIKIGSQVRIRLSSQGTADTSALQQEMTTYTDHLDQLSDGFKHHVVVKGETLYSLSRAYHLSIDSLRYYNPLELQDGLKLGSILRIPDEGARSAQATPGTTSASAPTTVGAPAIAGVAVGAVPDATTGATAATTPGWITESPLALPAEVVDSMRFREVNTADPIRIAMLLPLQASGRVSAQFVEFYQGALVALDELKAMGISTQIDLYNSERSAEAVAGIVSQGEFEKSNLIVGPVYDAPFAAVADYALAKGIPAISPLAEVKSVSNPALFQVAPTSATKYEKLKSDLQGGQHVVLVSVAGDVDQKMEQEIAPYLPEDVRRYSFSRATASALMDTLQSDDKEHVFVVLAKNETNVESILAQISSVRNYQVSRSMKAPEVKVIGGSSWARFHNIDRSLYFKLNLSYITSYHADRGSVRVVDFDARYVRAFEALPSFYAYRGYDVTKLFVSALKLHGDEFVGYLNEMELPLLQTPYSFGQSTGGDTHVNTTWPKVSYKSNYTIEVD